jgi:hypothetical protein
MRASISKAYTSLTRVRNLHRNFPGASEQLVRLSVHS